MPYWIRSMLSAHVVVVEQWPAHGLSMAHTAVRGHLGSCRRVCEIRASDTDGSIGRIGYRLLESVL